MAWTLIAATGLGAIPGCGSEPPTPAIGSAEFEAARKNYQDVRRSEYRRESLDKKAKAIPKAKAQ